MNDDDTASDTACRKGEPPVGKGFFSSLKRKLRLRERSGDPVREAIEDLIEDEQTVSINSHEKLLLSNVLRLRDVTAYDVMVPRGDIVAVEEHASLHDIIALASAGGHSRLPIYRGTLDETLGTVHIKDVLPVIARGDGSGSLQSLARKVLFVSPAIRVLDLLKDMRLRRTHMALVVDEYGGIDGLVTIEDLVEQIVGDIEDEHDADDVPAFQMEGDRIAWAESRLPLEEFEQRFAVAFSDKDKEGVDTLGGLVFRLAGRVPLRGEVLHHPSGLEFEVIDADPRRIRRLRIRGPRPSTKPPDRAA